MAVIGIGALVLLVSGLSGYLTIDSLKAKRDVLLLWRVQNPVLLVALYFFGYVLSTALAIPGASIFTLAGGLLFGLWWGSLLVSLASTTGATVACVLSRYFFGGWIQRRFRDNLVDINRGFQRDGSLYLLSLRLIPLFPFFMVNLLMGVLPIRLTTFFWVSLVGMFPATFLYVNAGTHLGRVNSVGDILSPGILVSLALLGLIPLLGQWIFKLVRRPLPKEI